MRDSPLDLNRQPAASLPDRDRDVGPIRFRPLGHRLFRYVLIFGTVLALLTTAVQMIFDYKTELRVIDDRLYQIERSYRPIFASSLWTFDEAQVKIGLQGITSLPDIVSASIETSAGRTYSSGPSPDTQALSRSFPLVYEVQKGSKATLGILRVYASLDGVYSRLRASLLENLATNAVKIFLTAVFILYLFQRLVTRHLGVMADYTRQLGLSTLDRPLSLQRGASATDEIDQVATAINNMRQSLQREQEALRATEERFSTVFHLSPLGIAILRLSDLRFVEVNDAYCRITGKTRAVLLARTMAELELWESPSERAAISRLRETDATTEVFKFAGEKKGDEARVGLAAVTRITLNEEAHLLAVIQDITELERTQETLRWRTALFEAQLNSELDGILVVDGQGKKLIQNQRLNELWKIPPEIAADPHDPRQLEFCASRTKNPKQFFKKVTHLYTHTNEICRDEVELADGTVLDRYTSPVRDAQGRYYGRVWTFRDVTARTQLEEQYRQAQKMEAFGQMAGGVAHDFNNIMTAVLMQLNLMEMEPDIRASTRSSLSELNGYVQRGANLTRQLLMFSRKQARHVQTLDLNRVIEGLTNMLRRILGENYELVFENPGSPIWIEADAGMIEQVALNLCVNARDAMSEGGRILLSTQEVERFPQQPKSQVGVGRYALLSVTDTGCGMDEATQKRIFEPFFTTKPLGKGTGLGLATVYGIVNQHRGWIEVTSEFGKGSTFNVFIPASLGPTKTQTQSPLADTRGGTETILLVEDDPAIRPVTAILLARYGYRVIEASNGVEALQKWEKKHAEIDLLLTDMIMPEGLTGLQLATQLLRESETLKVIISSGYNTEIPDAEDPLIKRVRFLPKPFAPRKLLALVRRCLDAAHNIGKESESPF